jgi:hypothetical protein
VFAYSRFPLVNNNRREDSTNEQTANGDGTGHQQLLHVVLKYVDEVIRLEWRKGKI